MGSWNDKRREVTRTQVWEGVKRGKGRGKILNNTGRQIFLYRQTTMQTFCTSKEQYALVLLYVWQISQVFYLFSCALSKITSSNTIILTFNISQESWIMNVHFLRACISLKMCKILPPSYTLIHKKITHNNTFSAHYLKYTYVTYIHLVTHKSNGMSCM